MAENRVNEVYFYKRLLHLPRPRYPFPDLVSPHIDVLAAEYCQWIDTDCQFESNRARESHKRHRLSDIAARAFPRLTLEELRPVARFTAFLAIIDDCMDNASREELETVRAKVSAICSSKNGTASATGFYHQIYMMRQDALRCGMPEQLYQQFIEAVLDLMTGYGDEKQYNTAGKPPPLETYQAIRQRTSGGICYAKYLCMQKNYRLLPGCVLNHPAILRMHSLVGSLIGYHNDFISLPKELSRAGDVVNIVLAIQHQLRLGLDAAWRRALEIHNEALDEFIELQNNLPNFGDWQYMAQDYVNDLGTMVQGVYSWHTKKNGRYMAGSYVEPEQAGAVLNNWGDNPTRAQPSGLDPARELHDPHTATPVLSFGLGTRNILQLLAVPGAKFLLCLVFLCLIWCTWLLVFSLIRCLGFEFYDP